MSNEVKLSVNNLKVSFRTDSGKVQAVRDISFDLHKGETLAIVGESGSGKSVTSKAIMGILSGNSIIEGGEIHYDGQDLLKIGEDEYYKIRGDKIAMIFQDPMSSLNPIMKVGQQLTEAMILKAKTGKKNAKYAFNTLLKTLGECINLSDAERGVDYKDAVAAKLKTFDTFCISAIEIEGEYNEAFGNASQLEVDLDNYILVNRKKKLDLNTLKRIQRIYVNTYNIDVVTKEEGVVYEEELKNLISNYKTIEADAIDKTLVGMFELIKKSIVKEKPNFFTLGYYKLKNPNVNVDNIPVAELNAMTRDFLDKDFMLDFIATAEHGVRYSHARSINAKKFALAELESAYNYFNAGNIEEKESKKLCDKLSEIANDAIDRLAVKKVSAEYVFESSIKAAVNDYFYGVKRNPVEERIYLKNKAKYDKLVSRGNSPDWVLLPQVVIDLDEKRANICKIISNLMATYQHAIECSLTFDANYAVNEIIDFFKEQASKFVVKMNKSIAKAKAVKLLEEVGIPEPMVRFNQYPFEFSGGMRQRIVIAIALSANPDILICDEPTTALDVTIQAQILELINVIKRERNLSVIFITHNLGVVANMADKIAVMYAGKIVEHGTAEEIFYEPAHPYTWALLSSMPDLETKEKLESIPGTPPNMIYPPKGDAFAARNKYALEIDFELQPPMFEITPTHSAATWLLHPNAPKVEMPALIKARIERLKKEQI